MASTVLKQKLKFIVRIERMKPVRWVKICRKEIKKRVENNRETDRGGVMRKKLAKWGADWRGIMSNVEGEMIQEMEKLITIDMEQTIQEDWARVESSTYCPYFKRLKTDIIMEIRQRQRRE